VPATTATRVTPAQIGIRRPASRPRRGSPDRDDLVTSTAMTSRPDAPPHVSRGLEPSRPSPVAHRRLAGVILMPTHSFILNGKQVSVDCSDDLRLLWVLRDLLGVHGPKYGCGLDVCKACTCHINGKAFNPDTASPVRSWPQSGWSTKSRPRVVRSPTPISIRCGTSAAVAHTPGSGRRSPRPPATCEAGSRRTVPAVSGNVEGMAVFEFLTAALEPVTP
jgi:hypothetical protein